MSEAKTCPATPSTWGAAFKTWWFPTLVFTLCTIWVYGDLCTGLATLYDADFRYMFLPLRHAFNTMVGRGELPTWTQGVRAGFPLHAAAEAGVFYPVNWLLAPFPATMGSGISISAHTLFGCLGLTAFLRRVGLRPTPATLASLAFFFGGYNVSHAGWAAGASVLAWWPLLLIMLDRHAQTDSPRDLVGAGVAGALMMLAGRPQYAIVFGLAAGLYYLVRRLATHRSWTLLLTSLTNLAAAGALCLVLAAPQILPTLSLMAESARADGVSQRHKAAATALDLEHLEALIRPVHGPKWRDASGSTAYIGIVGLLCGS